MAVHCLFLFVVVFVAELGKINGNTRKTTPNSDSVTIMPGKQTAAAAAFFFPSGQVLTGASASRQRLLAQLTHPFNQQQNSDILPTHVMAKLLPIKIQDLNEKSEILEITIRIQISWLDQRLAWDPRQFYNISELVVPGTTIWSPDVGVLNSVSDVYHVVHDTRFGLKVESTGRVWWHPTGIVKTYCKLYLRYFPFDRQRCKIVLESPTLDIRFMNLTIRPDSRPVDTIMYMGGETWDLVNVSGHNVVMKVGSKTRFSRIEFHLKLQRAKVYHLLNVILPAFFLSLVQVMFFLLPATHPQRVGSSTTTLLSVVVFHSVAVSQLPKTSTDVPLLAVYIIMVTFVSGLSVVTSIFVSKFTFYAEKNVKMPIWLRKIPNPWYCLCNLRWRFYRKSTSFPTTTTTTNITTDTLSPPPMTSPSTELQTMPWVDDDNKSRYDNDDEQMLPSPLQAETIKMKPSPTMNSARNDRAFLFNNWLEVSYFVDVSLMILAASIALFAPLLMFGIIPRLVDVDVYDD